MLVRNSLTRWHAEYSEDYGWNDASQWQCPEQTVLRFLLPRSKELPWFFLFWNFDHSTFAYFGELFYSFLFSFLFFFKVSVARVHFYCLQPKSLIDLGSFWLSSSTSFFGCLVWSVADCRTLLNVYFREWNSLHFPYEQTCGLTIWVIDRDVWKSNVPLHDSVLSFAAHDPLRGYTQ